MRKVQSMNILVLASDPRELARIQQALDGHADTVIPVSSSEQAWEHIQSGEARLLIADWDASDLYKTQFIQRLRASKVARSAYVLLITSRHTDDASSPTGMDDILYKPFEAGDLKHRVKIASRILLLAEDLAVARRQLEVQAMFDDLTGLMNRAAFLRQAAGELERSRRVSLPLSFIVLDIDNFKIINDMFGSQLGDEVLEIIARAIREKSRPYDCIGRWAGDEFIIALPGVIGADAEKIAGRIIAGVRGIRIEVPKEPPLNVKISAGIASLARVTTSTEIESIIQQAHQAVTRAKEAGGGQVFLVYL
jgi:two-component system, cell cycle response regulator